MKLIYSLLFLFMTLALCAQDNDYVSLQERLKSNVFLKVEASSTDCFVGEPIIVSYKLYSALASESSVAKNPNFSGFDVKDLHGANDGIASRETVDGVPFDVHTIRKLQLTPLKPGRLVLDALVMRNRIKLVDANGNEDPILDGVKEGYSLNKGYFTLTVSSVPITVFVTDLPNSSARPAKFNGLVGNFKMNVQLPKTIYAPGERGVLTITIIGTGDMSNIRQPEVEWPDGVEVLPARTDQKIDDKTNSGYKAFAIPFRVDKTGKYTIPSVKFSFFDPLTNKYKTITNIPVTFHVVKEGMPVSSVDQQTEPENDYGILLIGGAVVLALLLIVVLINRSRKKRYRPRPAKEANVFREPQPVESLQPLSIDDLLRPAADTIHHTGGAFYGFLKQALVKYFENRLALPAALFNKDTLKNSMTDNNIPEVKQVEVLNLLTEIEMHIYSGGGLDANKVSLLEKTKQALQGL